VMAMQYYFIRQSFYLKRQLFDESVMAAINTVALKVEKDEALRFLNHREVQERLRLRQAKENKKSSEDDESLVYANKMKMKRQRLSSEFKALEKQVKRRYQGAVLLDNDFYETYMKDPILRS